MDVLTGIVLALHIIGIAALLGGFLAQIPALRTATGRVTPGMLHGALTMLVTGIALVGLNEAGDGEVNHVKIAVKTVVLVAVLVIVVTRRKAETVASPLLGAIGALTALNVLLATLWN
ncbi:hypothetical protein [Streptomyces lonarensis]|uniref:Integral membrane protein n=1 Tax=Streptomyces lonarensis TaxID=700599 RepID=A0A7X6D5Y3_9ACTN|nr:hypothetical protein [Streptomyces lonarensis]NJQ08810.1 hypothetical protein [Streptomyces lonarensis]